MRKGQECMYQIKDRVKRLNRLNKFLEQGDREAFWYDQLTKEAGGLYTLLRKLKRDKKIVF